jgi:hypothetical protein
VVEASSSTARVLRLVLRLPDTHRDREERARPETAAHYSGEPEASPVSFFSPFSLCDLFLLIRGSFGDVNCGDELGFPL